MASTANTNASRAALACAGDAGSEPDCFEPKSIDYLAGHDREFGAVGAPDNDELSGPAAHCDNADFVAGGYPRTRDQATASLMDCVNQLRAQFEEGVDSAQGLLDDQGQVIAPVAGQAGRHHATSPSRWDRVWAGHPFGVMRHPRRIREARRVRPADRMMARLRAVMHGYPRATSTW